MASDFHWTQNVTLNGAPLKPSGVEILRKISICRQQERDTLSRIQKAHKKYFETAIIVGALCNELKDYINGEKRNNRGVCWSKFVEVPQNKELFKTHLGFGSETQFRKYRNVQKEYQPFLRPFFRDQLQLLPLSVDHLVIVGKRLQEGL